jgi:hypothetical protein
MHTSFSFTRCLRLNLRKSESLFQAPADDTNISLHRLHGSANDEHHVFRAHKITPDVTARHASLSRKRRLVYMETYILFILAISALISGLYHLSFGVYGFHLQDVVPIRPEVEGRLCLCLYGVHVHD